MTLPLNAKLFTTALTDSSLTINSSDGICAITVYNTTSTAGSVTGDQQIQSTTSSAISIGENESYNVTIPSSKQVIDGLTITAPSGCTLNITAIR
mgnify:CR=1 FL=1|tara:strand:+ start:3262 stop:3546 length:285 start_codon:yes stop_codon:yes gene_type:complete